LIASFLAMIPRVVRIVPIGSLATGWILKRSRRSRRQWHGGIIAMTSDADARNAAAMEVMPMPMSSTPTAEELR